MDQIRYVGLLSQINQDNQSVELKEIKIYGTEDREVEKKVPPSDEIIEIRVFLGTEIKDLKVIMKK